MSRLRYSRNGDQISGNVLLEPEVFIASIRLGPLLEGLVLGENVVRSGEDISVGPGTNRREV